MNNVILIGTYFHIPFFTGLLLAAALSLTGAWLHLRREWLAALGLSQIAAAGGIASLGLGIPILLGAALAATCAAWINALLNHRDNAHYAVMILFGWSCALLLAGTVPHGQVLGESLLRGQIYFSNASHLTGAFILLAVLLASQRWLSPRLLRERFFPDWYRANQMPAWKHRLLFGSLVVGCAVLGTLSMGAFPAFALFFFPAWVALRLVTGWRAALLVSVLLATVTYVAAFVLALYLDQPFGPILVTCLVATGILRYAGHARDGTT